MLAFPIHPRHARMLIEAGRLGVCRRGSHCGNYADGNVVLRGLGRDMRDKRFDSLGEETQSDLFLLVRAWQYAQKSGLTWRNAKNLASMRGRHARRNWHSNSSWASQRKRVWIS